MAWAQRNAKCMQHAETPETCVSIPVALGCWNNGAAYTPGKGCAERGSPSASSLYPGGKSLWDTSRIWLRWAVLLRERYCKRERAALTLEGIAALNLFNPLTSHIVPHSQPCPGTASGQICRGEKLEHSNFSIREKYV